MRTIETKIFTFDELSDEAKRKAIDAWRDTNFNDDYIIDYSKEIAEKFGLNINRIYYSGFYSQGDGACFEGSYKYKTGGLKDVKASYPKWTELHEIVERLQEIQRKNFYRLFAVITHRGHYYHSGCMNIDVEDNDDMYRDLKEAEVDIKTELRNFADLIYSMLSNAFDYEQSDEYVTESIRANEQEFTEQGN